MDQTKTNQRPEAHTDQRIAQLVDEALSLRYIDRDVLIRGIKKVVDEAVEASKGE